MQRAWCRRPLQSAASNVVRVHTNAFVRWDFGIDRRRDAWIAGEDIDLTSNHLQAPILGDETTVMAPTVGEFQAFEFRDEHDCSQRNHGRVDSDRAQRRDGFSQGSATCRETRRIEPFEAYFLIGSRTNRGTIAVALREADRFPGRQSPAALNADAIVKVAGHVCDELAGGIVDRGVFRPRVFFGEVLIRVPKSFPAAKIQALAPTFQHELHGFVRGRRARGRGTRSGYGGATFFRRRSVFPSGRGPTWVFQAIRCVAFALHPRLTGSGHTCCSGQTPEKRQRQSSHCSTRIVLDARGPSPTFTLRPERVSEF